MWDLEAKAIAGAARDRGETVVVIGGAELARWRKATDPVIAGWQKQLRDRKLDGGKLLAEVHALLGKYADEPDPHPQATRRPAQPPEQKAVTEPPSEAAQPRPEAVTPPKADTPALEAAASPPPPASAVPTPAQPPAASMSPPTPAQASPAPVAAPKLKAFDIPL
jgi:hypothetical protein